MIIWHVECTFDPSYTYTQPISKSLYSADIRLVYLHGAEEQSFIKNLEPICWWWGIRTHLIDWM